MPRLLVYSKTDGFRHDSIADGVRAVAGLAKERGWDWEPPFLEHLAGGIAWALGTAR